MPAKDKKTAPKVNKSSSPVIKKSAGKIDPKFDVYQKLLLKTKDQISGDIRHLSDDNAGSGTDRGGDISGHALHMADVATDMYDREFNLGLAANDRELLTSVNQAMDRIKDGSFGICFECKKPIASTRLKAIPYTVTCLKCQEKIESKRR
ncbi:MAG: TraR/DksA family transcriptional regulator [Candidatus Omnitrophica bacterium]|nr:TraR/DksA family transcriptional regulator [Candidatus Omnitrophota bacterium]